MTGQMCSSSTVWWWCSTSAKRSHRAARARQVSRSSTGVARTAAWKRSRSRRNAWCMTYMPVWSWGPSATWVWPGRQIWRGRSVFMRPSLGGAAWAPLVTGLGAGRKCGPRSTRDAPAMNRILGPLGRHSAAHPWRTILLWVVGVAAAFALASAVGAPAQENWDAPPGTPSQRGVDLLRAHLPEAGNASAQVVVHDPAADPVSDETLARARRAAPRDAARPRGRPSARLRGPRHRAADRPLRRTRHPPRPDGSRRASGGGGGADPRRRAPGRARRRAACHCRRAGQGHRRADRHRRRR